MRIVLPLKRGGLDFPHFCDLIRFDENLFIGSAEDVAYF